MMDLQDLIEIAIKFLKSKTDTKAISNPVFCSILYTITCLITLVIFSV